MSETEWNELKSEVMAETLYSWRRRNTRGLEPELAEAMSKDTLVAQAYARLADEWLGGRSYSEAEVGSEI